MISFPLYSLFSGEVYDFSTIKNGELFLSYPRNFNDPFDGAILIDLNEFIKEYLSRRFGEDIVTIILEFSNDKSEDVFSLLSRYKTVKTSIPICAEIYPEEFDFFSNIDVNKLKEDCLNLYNDYIIKIKEFRNEYGVACFTSNLPENNMVMWAHYANNYKGFCCKFEFDYYNVNTNRDTNGTANILKHFHKITYTNKIPCLNAKKLLDCPLDKIKTSKYINGFVKKALTLKHKQWKYENEYRIIIHKDSKFFEKTFNKNNCGFKIAFPYLKSLYINYEKCVDEASIVDIATTHNIKYYGLTASQNGAILVNDTSVINLHNILLEAGHI
ncbi:MAG: DUF2971 domain-containing protein [Clostridia bacterium]|nr:DUF2971 domain-containing protein [Clostridia bacterium]